MTMNSRLLGRVCWTTSRPLINPSLSSLVSRATPPNEQGAYLGLYQSVLSLARICGPLLAGFVFERFDPTAPFWTGAMLLFVSGTIAFWYHRRYAATFPRTSTPSVAAV